MAFVVGPVGQLHFFTFAGICADEIMGISKKCHERPECKVDGTRKPGCT
jgi:hypothetical protein